MTSTVKPAAVGLILTVVTTTATADNWPMWRGPNGDGVSQEADVPLRWSPTENIVWRKPIRGVGNSSPIVWGDAVFVTSADLDSRERLLMRIDRRSGDVEWMRTVAIAEIEPMHRLNSPASGTPATDGELVYVMFQTGDELLIKAYDFLGEEVWSQIPGEFKSRHGFNSSPVIDGDSLLISGIQDGEDAFIARLDCLSGAIDWKRTVDNPVRSFSTPFLFTSGGQRLAVLSGANRTIGYDPLRGEILWTVNGPAEKTVSSLVCDDDRVFVAGGRDNMLLAIRPDGSQQVGDSQVVWRATRGIPYVTSPLMYGGYLHVISDEGIYSCFDPASGEVLLRKRLGGTWSSSPVGACDRVYLTSESGVTTVITAGPDFEVLSHNDVGEPVYASLAVSQGELFVRGKDHLFRIARTDEVRAARRGD